MDRNVKIAFGITGASIVFSLWKAFRIHERVEMLEKIVDLMHEIQEVDFQKEINQKFEEIADEFDT